jgi:hypothetical protein
MRLPPIQVVPGEEELGEQRYCRGCDYWWPHDAEFWGRSMGSDGYPRTWCRACRYSQWETLAHGRKRVAA